MPFGGEFGCDMLCSHSLKGKLWVSIIEKAYLKIQGGYSFVSNNPSRDLYALTGWLPEKIPFKDWFEFNGQHKDLTLVWSKVF